MTSAIIAVAKSNKLNCSCPTFPAGVSVDKYSSPQAVKKTVIVANNATKRHFLNFLIIAPSNPSFFVVFAHRYNSKDALHKATTKRSCFVTIRAFEKDKY